jgi:hypothetical protein
MILNRQAQPAPRCTAPRLPLARILQAVLCSALLLTGASYVRHAWAHHGFGGEYNYAKPLYLQGKITQALPGYPHARYTLQIIAPALPQDRSALVVVDQHEGRSTSQKISLPRNLRAGQTLTVLFDPLMSRQLADAGSNAPHVGQVLTAIAYERISQDRDAGELRVLHVQLADGRFLSGTKRSYHVER